MLNWLRSNAFLTQWISSFAALLAAFAGILGALAALVAAAYPIVKDGMSGFLTELRVSLALLTALLVLRFSSSQKTTEEAWKTLVFVGFIYLFTMAAKNNLKTQVA